MPQETNLNVAPYFDDFDPNKDYYKVLFKPGYPIQARELTTLQSILQNQIEKFGQHFFKEGAKVIPGNIAYNNIYHAIEISNEYLGISISQYLPQIVDRKITGRSSGVSAVVKKYLRADQSERGNATLYISYIGSSTIDNENTVFADGELLTIDQTVSFGGKIIAAGEAFASTIPVNCVSTASAFSITNGVYFAKGQFIAVNDETVILDQYSNKPSYRIGLLLREDIVSADEDPSLNDNSRGFNNYSAPGADRLKISARLHKKSLDDFDDNDFVELATVTNGVLRSVQKNNTLGGLNEELARRTYQESGDYYVSPFAISIKESLDDNLGNNGVFSRSQTTDGGSVPSDNLALYQISPGKALVKGYEVETISPTYIDVPKPRQIKTLGGQRVNYFTGPTISLNRVYGNPQIGIGNTFVLSLRDERVGFAHTYGSSIAPATKPSGKEIGLARVYDFRLESGEYDSATPNRNRWEISLYDVQPFTEITLNQPITLQTPSHIKGKYSGATAFLRHTVNAGTALTVYQKTGDFIQNENFIIDGVENNRVAIAVTAYSIADIKSVHGQISAGSTFSADVVQSDSLVIGLATVSEAKYNKNVNFLSATVSQNIGIGSTTIFISNLTNVSVGDSITVGTGYTNARIVSVGNTFVQISAASTTSGTSLNTSLSQNPGIGTNTFFVGFTTGVSIGSSVTVGSAITNATITGVGATFFQIGSGSTVGSITTTTSIGQAVSFGSTVIFLNDTVGITSFSTISATGVGTIGALTNIPVVEVGANFVYIGTASTSYPGTSVGYTTSLSQTVGIGSTQIFVGFTTGTGISIGSSVNVGSAMTNVSVVAVGNSFVLIGTGDTIGSTISSGVAVTFTNVSSLVVGTAVTVSGVNPIVSGIAVTFSRVSDALSGAASTISYVLSTSTVVSNKPSFSPNNFNPYNIVKYTDTTLPNPVLARVVSVGTTSIEIAAVRSVTGVTSSILPTSTLQVSDFTLQKTNLKSSTDNSLYTPLPRKNISNVDLTAASLTIRKVDTVNIQGNQLQDTLVAGPDEIFLPFYNDRYSLVRSDGTSEILTSDKFNISANGKQLQILNLGSNNTGATLITTRQKDKVTAKLKYKNRVNNIIVDKSITRGSGTGTTTINDGLAYGNYPYGVRVQDDLISLNTPDVLEIHGIYESLDTNDPSAPTMSFTSLNGPSGRTSDLIIGEKITGQTSKAVAIVAKTLNDNQIEYIVKNQGNFIDRENVVFEESRITGVIGITSFTSSDISFNYTFLSGQNSTFYNYGAIRRKPEAKEPSKKIKVYFSSAYYDATDNGDITTKESYNTFDYSYEIQTVDSIRNTDILDIRPRVSDYTVAENALSPLEFLGRTFSGSGNSAANILASDNAIEVTFSYYLGRIDRVFVTKEGVFQVQYGVSSETPELPIPVDNSLEIARVTLPPYLYNVGQASVSFLDYKRYRMVDINQLENRIKNLEYYTSLSLLETNTANLFVPDANGLNRFKSGFYVDNFTTTRTQESGVSSKNSIDPRNKEIRPSHFTTQINLKVGPVAGVDPTSDASFRDPEGTNIRRNGSVITLDYTEVEFISQLFGTRSESVTPYLVSFWNGTLELTPSTDTWMVPNRIEANVQQVEGNYSQELARAQREFGVDPNTGFAPTVWSAWSTEWSGETVIRNRDSDRNVDGGTEGGSWGRRGFGGNGGLTGGEWNFNRITNVFRDTIEEKFETGVESRTGTRTQFTEYFDRVSLGDRVTNRATITTMRSRNIQFVSNRLLPNSKVYAFFDGVDVTRFCVPKLLEISMISGTFQVGEEVRGVTRTEGTAVINDATKSAINFRVAATNHKSGPYNFPTKTYTINPYLTGNQTIPATYSSTSTILNVDTASLASMSDNPEYRGYVEQGMTLVGQTSGAQATITNVRLISDVSANLTGSFFIPDPTVGANPRFSTGTKTLTLINDSQNNFRNASTVATERFISSGTIETVQENIISIRQARIETKDVTPEQRDVERLVGSQVVGSRQIDRISTATSEIRWYDPLAQSFLVPAGPGVFITKCDIYFQEKDDMGMPVTLQIRTMQGGYPTTKILPFSEIVKSPDEVNVSADGSVPTTFTFSAPVYLAGDTEYAICVAAISTKYKVLISRVGENDLISQAFVAQQPYLGSLFKSQNASTWEASQWEDLKFKLYRADFSRSGTVQLYNPDLTLGNNQIATLMPDSLSFTSRKVRVGLGSTLQDSNLVFGNTVSQSNSNGTGNYVGNAGIATGTLNIINPGIGYTPALGAGSQTYTNVNLVNVTGSGLNATANITVSNGVAIAATISGSGFGHEVGDVFTVNTLGISSVGRDMRLSLVSIASTNTLILDNVQGEFKTTGIGNTVQYTNSLGITTVLNYSTGGNVPISSVDTVADGLHVKINHANHGMYFDENKVTIGNVKSDIAPTVLSAEYSSTSTGNISVTDSTNFGTFENVSVASTNKGYLLIGNEVISYTQIVSPGVIGGITRAVSTPLGTGSTSRTYPAGTPVYKYELSGVSLTRINKTHTLSEATISNPISYDSYTIKLDMGASAVSIGRSDGVSYPKLFANTTKSAGGNDTKATQNIPFEIIHPQVHNTTVNGTSISAAIRTVSSVSISGNEIPHIDNGYQPATLDTDNYLTTPRAIYSKINESTYLTSLPGSKSFSMRVNLETNNSNISPVLDLDRATAILISNRINRPFTDEQYITDNRVNSINNDPHAFQYISKEITLENPATSLKLLLNAHINTYTDIRAFYAISESQGFTPIYKPFLGYENLSLDIYDTSRSTGHSDFRIQPSPKLGFVSQNLDFSEYSFTADQLPAFRSYRIKIIMTSTNQVYVPRIKDLRTIALA